MEKFITHRFEETQKLGQDFARGILEAGRQNHAVVLALKGDLGAGKTTFLQGFAKYLGTKENILSPTFVIMKRFEMKKKNFKNFYHFDLYRLNSPEEILHLGFEEIISNPENIVAIEWPEKLGDLLPKNSIKITLGHDGENQRSLKID